MPARGPKSRAHHAQPQPSDYDTDAAPQVDVPIPPPRSNEDLNLSVIRRHYPDVMDIHYVASYAALYVYSGETEQWERSGAEGSLFICQLFTTPTGIERFSVILLNRKGLENFTMEITDPDDIDFGDYIFLKSDQIYGLWIHSDPPPSSTANTLIETQQKLTELAARALASRLAALPNPQGQVTGHEQLEGSVPMGRQLSLRELFGQSPQRLPDVAQQHHFTHNQGQDIAHAGFVPTPSPQPLVSNDVLSQLFMKAKQDYHG